ncbi:intracellular septation protein A [Saccharopolyspora lacisalsi]|uniref:Intracellular septation protein A n=1 Tax=Halosaccharopolyspora lacisalsi TaxID=1000566 RepID=A0A839E733_9PSEU|nr:VC0807 family protein [Halosaccharopolyspora lacisalsi]MBA8827507.1 intracellular septation protein A [Halosaccharopolyspora lacisalsi]
MLRSVLPTLIDVFVPVVVYFVLRGFGVASFWALTIGASVSVVSVLVGVFGRRRLDGVPLLVLLMFSVGIAITFLTHDPRILLVKPSFFFVVVGGYMVVSCFLGRPLMYEFIRPVAAGGDAESLARFELTWEQVPRFRKMVYIMTVVWGVTWIGESLVRVVVVYSFPQGRVGEALIWTVVALVVCLLPALVFTFVGGRRMLSVGAAFNETIDQDELAHRTRQVSS